MRYLESFSDVFKKKSKPAVLVTDILDKKYNLGDYVLINRYDNYKLFYSKIVFLIEDMNFMGKNGLYKLTVYVCELSDGRRRNAAEEKNSDMQFFIERKMTDEEIEKYELESTANKYNI